jgi:hypothetical protein
MRRIAYVGDPPLRSIRFDDVIAAPSQLLLHLQPKRGRSSCGGQYALHNEGFASYPYAIVNNLAELITSSNYYFIFNYL